MPLPFLKFPSLVCDYIFERMELKDIFVLSTLSKKSRKVIRRSFANQQVQMSIDEKKSFSLKRLDDFFVLECRDFAKLRRTKMLAIGSFLNVDSVPMEMNPTRRTSRITTYWKKNPELINLLIDHYAQIFPKLKANLQYEAYSGTAFLKTTKLIKSHDIELGEVSVYSSMIYNEIMVKVLLDECRSAEPLWIVDGDPSRKFRYDPEDSKSKGPFEFSKILIEHAHWVTVDHFNTLFINCESVNLRNREFTDEELKKILKSWMEGSRMEKFAVQYHEESLAPIFEVMKGVVPVEKALIHNDDNDKSVGKMFGPGQAYLLTQKDESTSIVYLKKEWLFISTDFELEDDNEDEWDWEFDNVHIDDDIDDDDDDDFHIMRGY